MRTHGTPPPAEPGGPSPALVSDMLDRIRSHRSFANSPNLLRFLEFVVAETLAGRADRLKAYTVATVALGRPDDFDPAVNPIVRVEATRLRRKLEIYYATDGMQDPLRIRLATGAYRAEFEMQTVVPSAPAALPATTGPPPTIGPPARAWLAPAAMALLLGSLALQAWTLSALAELRDRRVATTAACPPPLTAGAERDLETGSVTR